MSKNNSIWRFDLSQITDVKPDQFSIHDFRLLQNYPNPFNPSTKIGYEIREEGNVEIKIYDILGREVSTLVKQFQKAGRYEVELNAGNLANGIYFYKLQAGSFSDTKKLTLLK